MKEEWRASIEAFERSLAIDDSFAWPHMNKARALEGLAAAENDASLISLALESYRKATRRVPRQSRPLNCLARLLGDQGDIKGAFRAYADTLELDIVNETAHRRIREILSTNAVDVQEAADTLRRRLEEAVEAENTDVEIARTLDLLSRSAEETR